MVGCLPGFRSTETQATVYGPSAVGRVQVVKERLAIRHRRRRLAVFLALSTDPGHGYVARGGPRRPALQSRFAIAFPVLVSSTRTRRRFAIAIIAPSAEKQNGPPAGTSNTFTVFFSFMETRSIVVLSGSSQLVSRTISPFGVNVTNVGRTFIWRVKSGAPNPTELHISCSSHTTLSRSCLPLVNK